MKTPKQKPRGKQFKPGNPGGPGRPKGEPNKLTSEIKSILENVFLGIGGEQAMVEWAKSHRSEFYTIWAKMLPKDPIDVNLKSPPRIVFEYTDRNTKDSCH
jgi:hypothetical protein